MYHPRVTLQTGPAYFGVSLLRILLRIYYLFMIYTMSKKHKGNLFKINPLSSNLSSF